MKVFVDNVATQAVETCLLARLTDILSPTSILEMDATLITAIAGEPEESQAEREQLTRKLTVLKSGLEICKRYAGRPTRKRAHEESFKAEGDKGEQLPLLKRTPGPKAEMAQPATPAGNPKLSIFANPFTTSTPPPSSGGTPIFGQSKSSQGKK